MSKTDNESPRKSAELVPEARAEIVPAMTSDSGGRLLTRTEAARRLGISESTLRRREAEGALKPSVVRGRTPFYEETVVSTVMQTIRKRWSAPETTDGVTAARVFDLLAGGVSLRDIVVRLELPPEVVSKLATQWAELGEGFFVTAPEAAEMGVRNFQDLREKIDEARSSAANALGRMDATSPRCRVCEEEGSAVCHACHEKVRETAYGREMSGLRIRIEGRVAPEGDEEVSLVVEECTLRNRETRRMALVPALKTAWEKRGPGHWSDIFRPEPRAT